MSQEDVASALKRYQKHADMLRSPLEHLLQHLSQVAQNPQELRIDWPTIVEAFLSFDKRLGDASKEIQDKKEVLQHVVVYPSTRPPPVCDVPLLLSSRDHLDMEMMEADVLQAFKESQDQAMDTTTTEDKGGAPSAVQEKVTALNQEVDKLVSFFTAQAASTKEAMEAYTNPHLKEKPWRAQSKDDVESVFAFLENFREGRDPPLR